MLPALVWNRDADKIHGDGPLDVKSGCTWVSSAYNHFYQTDKSNGVGFGKDTDALVMTYHHNFYDACGSRMPRISYVSMHVFHSPRIRQLLADRMSVGCAVAHVPCCRIEIRII